MMKHWIRDIIDARSTADQEYRKSVYKQCLDIILDWAVEIPIYQRQNCVIYSPEAYQCRYLYERRYHILSMSMEISLISK